MTEHKTVGNIHSILTFGTLDGPGIRYVLFLQGCNFTCKYCHNRDMWSSQLNRLMTVQEVIDDYNKYKEFYKDGGITVSGGEPTLQLEFLIELFKEAQKNGIHTCLDTASGGYQKNKKAQFIELLKYTDLVLLDIKAIDKQKHFFLVGQNNDSVFEFAKLLNEKRVNTIIRYVLVPQYNNDQKSLKDLRAFLMNFQNIIDIEVLPYHKMGIFKWEQLGYEYPLQEVQVPSDLELNEAIAILKKDFIFHKK